MYKLIDGKRIAEELRLELKKQIELFKTKYSREIGLAVVMAGNDAASQIYVKNKIKACSDVGIKSYSYFLGEKTTGREIEDLIKNLAVDSQIDGILVQLPLPAHLDAKKILKLIPVEKDVDGFSAENTGKLCFNEDCLSACTPYGVMQLLKRENIQIKGKHAVIVGRSDIVGKPMALMMLNSDATVTVCHSKTENLKKHCLEADILISALGKPKFITADMVKEGAVVIDIGINRMEGKICGDVDFENVKEKCSYITPVPGGVGPMTITMLLYNTYKAALGSEN